MSTYLSHTTHTQVTIVLKDINDLAPEFVTPNETSVAENIPPNTVIMAIKAVDRDEGRNGYVEYQLEDDQGSLPSPFTVGQADGLLRVSGQLDREAKPSYELSVIAKDRGDPPRMTQSRIRINVLDENDNSPIFDPKQYSAAIAENASIGASVLQVRYSNRSSSMFLHVPFIWGSVVAAVILIYIVQKRHLQTTLKILIPNHLLRHLNICSIVAYRRVQCMYGEHHDDTRSLAGSQLRMQRPRLSSHQRSPPLLHPFCVVRAPIARLLWLMLELKTFLLFI